MKINIAGTIFEIHFLYEKEYLTYFSSYQVEEGSPDFFIYQDTYEENVDKGDLKIESKAYDLYVQDDLDIQYQKNINNEYIGKIIYDKESSRFSSKDNHDYLNVVTMLLYIVTRYLMTHKDCILMLGSAFSYKGKGIIITSSSEEDASIHTSLWNQYFDIVYINDRINFIIKDNDKLYLYGNPWSKDHNLDNNIIVELNSIIFLNRDENINIRKLDKTEIFFKLTNQIVTPQDAKTLQIWNDMLSKIVEIPSYSFSSRIDKESALALRNVIDNQIS